MDPIYLEMILIEVIQTGKSSYGVIKILRKQDIRKK